MSAFKFQWVPHTTRMMPVTPNTRVAVRFPDGFETEGLSPADCWEWNNPTRDGKIVAYRVVEVRP